MAKSARKSKKTNAQQPIGLAETEIMAVGSGIEQYMRAKVLERVPYDGVEGQKDRLTVNISAPNSPLPTACIFLVAKSSKTFRIKLISGYIHLEDPSGNISSNRNGV